MKKPATYSANIEKNKLKVQKLHQRIENIRTDYENKIIHEIIRQKPRYITMEDLNVKGMMKNRHLARAVANQRFYYFRTKLTAKAKHVEIEMRTVNRFYPSSKLCSCCGHIKKELKLKDRVYTCSFCGFEIDRDLNASIAKEYEIA